MRRERRTSRSAERLHLPLSPVQLGRLLFQLFLPLEQLAGAPRRLLSGSGGHSVRQLASFYGTSGGPPRDEAT